MNKYVVEIWYRHGKFEKDFEVVEIDADTEAEAFLLARDLKHWVFKVNLVSKNGVIYEKYGES